MPTNSGGFTPASFDAIWSQDQFFRLCEHLHCSTPTNGFGHAFVGKQGELHYCHNKTRRYAECVASSWASIVGESPKPYGLMVGHNGNERDCSTFFAFDLDAHTPNGVPSNPKPAHYAPNIIRDVRVFETQAAGLCETGIYYLSEDSGRGWHLWLLSVKPLSISEWRRLSSRMKSAIEFSTTIEEYPFAPLGRVNGRSGAGKLIRVPGSSNPATFNPARGDWSNGIIFASNLNDAFWSSLPPFIKEEPLSIFNEGLEDIDSTYLPDAPQHKLATALLIKHRIDVPSVRHIRTLAMMAEGIYQFSRAVLMQLADQLYIEASPTPGTLLEGHRRDSQDIYDYTLQTNVLPTLNSRETEAFRSQRHDSSRAAFLILHNFAKLNPFSFPISGPDLAKRLMITTPSTYEIIGRLQRHQIITCVDASWQKGRRAKRYRWLLGTT